MRIRRYVSLCLSVLFVMGCSTINSGFDSVFGSDATGSQNEGQSLSSEQSNELSEIEKAEQARLLRGRSSRPSLASLQLMPQGRELNADPAQQARSEGIPSLSLAEKRAEYEALLPLITDASQRRQVAFRLADINMLLAEQDLEQGSSTVVGAQSSAAQNPFDPAIAGYLEVLGAHEVKAPNAASPLNEDEQALNRKQMDAMYQLSRALDLAAKKEESVNVAKRYLATFPVAEFGLNEQHIELYFRIGEYYFNRQQYADAGEYYGQVLAATTSGQLQNTADFYGISAYMLGWSEFKQDNYILALNAFDLMLRHTLGEAKRLEYQTLNDIEDLSKGERRLLSDSIRVMALTFSYQGSGEALNDFYNERDNSPYQHLIYEELAQQYLDEDRFADSADALLAFAEYQPYHPRAVEFYVRHIDAYILGGFPQKVLNGKQGFVSTYSLGGEVLKRLDSPIGDAALPYLEIYISELAQTEHSIAQSIDAMLIARAGAQNNASDSQASFAEGFASIELSQQQAAALKTVPDEDLRALRVQAYENAIGYYENYIRTFSGLAQNSEQTENSTNANVAERRFYLAEAYMALQRYPQAIEAFEIYAYEDTPNPMAVEAAYAAILAHAEISSVNTDERDASILMNTQTSGEALTDAKQTSPLYLSPEQFSQQRYILTFASDRRSPVIALNLMQTLFNARAYEQAQRWALWLLNPDPEVHSSVSKHSRSASLVMAHSEFETAQFASAESYYRQLLLGTAPQSESTTLNALSQRDALIDRLAASLYMQAEQILAPMNLTPAELSLQEDVYNMPLSDVMRTGIAEAIAFWQTIIRDTPSSSFRKAAQFDSASYYALLGEWSLAIQTWKDFAQRYPDDPLSSAIDQQLLYAYQQTENWQAAGDILLAQSKLKDENGQATSQAQDALYQAALFYVRAENRDMALDSFRRYAHAYPEPLEMANEARFRMSEFYVESGEGGKRRYWLDKMLQTQLNLAAQSNSNVAQAGTPRSRYLAAMSAMVFAKDADTAFSRIKLSLPLAQSLTKKQAALSKAIAGYDQVMGFAVAEYASEANYQLANLYLQLADDLMSSSRPSDLSTLELSQYELLLEEQAFPFEETALQLHENNAYRAQSGLYDRFVKQSFSVLSENLPVRYNKQEIQQGVSVHDL